MSKSKAWEKIPQKVESYVEPVGAEISLNHAEYVVDQRRV